MNIDLSVLEGKPAVVVAERDDYLAKRPLLRQLLKETEGWECWSEEGTEPGTAKRIRHVSASSLDAHGRCPRLNYGNHVLGIKQAQTPSMSLGTDVHAVIEDYGNLRVIPDTSTVAGQVALAGQHLFPDPDEVAAGEVVLEREFTFHPDGAVVPFYGLVDVLDFKRKTIFDHKTTSDFKYKKSAYELKVNPQAVVYSSFALSIGCHGVTDDGRKYLDFQHNYYRTRRPFQSDTERVRLWEEDLNRNLQQVITTANEIVACSQLPIEQVPYNIEACGDYRGCHMQDFCISKGVPVGGTTSLSTMLNAGLVTLQENPPMAMPSSLASLKKNAADARASATPTNELLSDVTEGTTPGIDPQPAPQAPPAPVTASGARFGTPTPAPVATPVQQQAVAPVGSINPPDGFDRNVAGTKEGPAMPQPAQSSVQEDIEARALKIQEEKQAAKDAAKAAKGAAAPKTGLPGKKKKDEEVPAATKVSELERVLGAAVAENVVALASVAPNFVSALAIYTEAQAAVAALPAQADIDSQVNDFYKADNDDAADELLAEYTKTKSKATRTLAKAEEQCKAAAEAAVEDASAVLAQQAEDARKAEDLQKAAAPVMTAPQSTTSYSTVTKEASLTPVPGTVIESTLYINCRPRKADVTFWEDFIAPYIERAEATRKTPYFRMLQHEANTAVMVEMKADMKNGLLVLPRNLVIRNFNSFTHGIFVEELASKYAEVVE